MSNKDITIIEKEISPIVLQAQEVKIKNQDDMKVAVDILSKLNKWNDSIIEDREKITKPLNEALKEVRAKYKPLEKTLEQAIEIVRNEMSVYQTAEVKRVQKEQDAIANRIREGKGGLKIETAMRKLDEIDGVADKVESDSGIVKFRNDKILKIVDISKIPDKYFDLNESALLKDLKAGVIVDGAELEDKLVPINSR